MGFLIMTEGREGRMLAVSRRQTYEEAVGHALDLHAIDGQYYEVREHTGEPGAPFHLVWSSQNARSEEE